MPKSQVEGSRAKRLAVFALGFLRQPRIGRILELANWKLQHFHWNRSTDAVGVWGRRPVSARGLAVARRTGLPVLNIEDAFLRSLHAEKSDPPLGLLVDRKALHFDSSQASELEDMLNTASLDDAEMMCRAKDGIAYLREHCLSKFNDWSEGDLPEPGFVLIVDQKRGDAAISMAGASENSFAAMLKSAREAHPETPILIRSHPLSASGEKTGHFGAEDCTGRVRITTDQVNPWHLLERASAVYCVSSQLGFEAILAGLRPAVFGQPFYAGWGLSEDINPPSRRKRALRVEQLFAAAMLNYPCWYDPCFDRKGSFETVARQLSAQSRAWREDVPGYVCTGMKPWKYKPLAKFFATSRGKPEFVSDPDGAVERAQVSGRKLVVWASKETESLREKAETAGVSLLRLEDGFLRSVGLGAELRPAASLVLDDLGIYFDPSRPSMLEAMINQSEALPQRSLDRAARLRTLVLEGQVSKYNIGQEVTLPDTAGRTKILVPGQVEDDASIRLGCEEIRTNLEVLRLTRAQNPDAFIIYKPHPDVEAGLRDGVIEADGLADFVAVESSITALLDEVDELWTLTSLAGFEALLRGCRVHCLGMPFYAGWGLTNDHGQVCARRSARPSLDALVHAVLIDYPRYFDPVSGLACAPETIVERLAERQQEMSRNPSRGTRILAKLQSRFSRYAHLWRR